MQVNFETVSNFSPAPLLPGPWSYPALELAELTDK